LEGLLRACGQMGLGENRVVGAALSPVAVRAGVAWHWPSRLVADAVAAGDAVLHLVLSRGEQTLRDSVVSKP
jgi:hypothetical protein